MNRSSTSELQDQLATLFSRINYERKEGVKPFDFKLDGIRQLLSELDSPHMRYPIIHVAGTKGKGSVSRMISAILSESGLKTGTYTSPHLDAINQRITVDGASISDDDLGKVLAEIQPAIEKVDNQSELANIRPLSFFEVITTAAFYHFAKSGCEAVVLEVGMGGRLDSTNVCSPKLCVITNIHLDHTRQLGNTLDKIAYEKAGILKPGVPLICGETKMQPKNVIHGVAESVNSEVWQLDREFFCSTDRALEQTLEFSSWGIAAREKKEAFQWCLDEVGLQVLGRHQATNGAIAIAAAQRLICDGWEIAPEEIKRGLGNLSLMARAEMISQTPPVVIDMAHNVASIEALVQTLDDHHSAWTAATRKRLILAISRDKDCRGIMRWLVDHFDEIVLTQYRDNPRGMPVAELERIAATISDGLQTKTDFHSAETPELALEYAESTAQSGDFLVIAGSVFLVAEMRPLFLQAN